MPVTIFLTILIIVGTILLIRRVTLKNPLNSEDKLNQKALIKLGALNGLHNYNSKTCEWIDNLLIKGIKSGIKSHNNNDTFNTIITFNNDMVFRFWDVNQYYGWLQKGMFTYYDEEKNELTHMDNSAVAQEAHGAGPQTAKVLFDMGAKVLITGNGPGGNAATILEKTGITSYVGAGEKTVKGAYESYKKDELEKL